jgi:hypothetical protein
MSKGALDDIARLKRIRYETKGAGALRATKPIKPQLEKLRKDMAKATKRGKKKGRR